MASLKQLRNRVKTIKTTQKITKAMQMVAASKLQKIKHQLNDSHLFLKILSDMMVEVRKHGDLQDLPHKLQKFFKGIDIDNKPELFIIITSERGLCGSFNSSIVKKLKKDISTSKQAGKELRLIIIGKKGYDLLKNIFPNYIEAYFNFSSNSNLFIQIKQKIMEMIEEDRIGTCNLYFNRFKNALTQIPTKKCLLPVGIEEIIPSNIISSREKNIEKPVNNIIESTSYEFEGENLITNLINLYINGQINFALLQSKAGEEGARMTAMDNATKNAGDMIDKVTLILNRSRQAIITKELIEITAGAEVVK